MPGTSAGQTDQFCRKIDRVTVSIAEWRRQRAILKQQESASLSELGFATLFLNRTNRSGIIHHGGVIGGLSQKGDWKLDVRFHKDDLIKRIRQIGRYRNRISIYQLDALEFTKKKLPLLRHAFTFFDPPYIEKGAKLYLNEYTLKDHQRIARAVMRLHTPWIVTYDLTAIRHRLYEGTKRIVYDLSYSARTNHQGREVMFLADTLDVPPLADLLGRRIIPRPQMSRRTQPKAATDRNGRHPFTKRQR